MSLINQMLKELDARRSDAGGGNAFGEQIRAVPDRRRVHPAWWVALGLGVSLAVVIGWVLLSPPAADPYMVRARLPLKLEVDLGRAVEGEPALPPAAGDAAVPLPSVEPVQEAAAAPGSNPAPLVQGPAQAAVSAAPPAAPLNPIPVAALPAPVPASAPSPAPVSAPEPAPLAAQPAPSKTASPDASRQRPVADAEEPIPQPAINKQVRELTPQQRAENEFRRATLAMQQGRRADAEAGFEQALQIDPKHPAARQALIAILLETRRNDEAMRYAHRGLELDPRQAGWAMVLARLQLEKGDLHGAIETLEKTRPHAPERADYLAFLAALLQRSERHKEAVEQYLQALNKVPHNGVWWMGLGISLQAERRKPEAQEAFMRAKASNDLSPDLLAFVDARLAQLK